MKPLPEHAALREMRAHAAIKLGREESGDAAHPGIRGLGEYEVEAPAARREIGLRVIEGERGACVVEDAVIGGIECPRRLDHFRLDLDRREVLHVWTA